MATRSLATDISAPAPTGLREDDYRTFCAALESTQRGRDFLAEYARRNRNADTGMLLDSLDRIEGMMATEGKARDRLRDELRVLLIAIRLARPDIDSSTALTKAARLADLLDLMEKRIDDMVENKDLPPVQEEPLPQFAPAALAVVPRPDEPELPIPTVTSLQGPVIALVQEPTRVVITPVLQDTAKDATKDAATITLTADIPKPELAIQEIAKQQAPKQDVREQELPKPAAQQAQELQPHEWAQLEILNQPRSKTLIDAEPYELWEIVVEAAPALAAKAEPVTAPKPAVTAAVAPQAAAAPAPTATPAKAVAPKAAKPAPAAAPAPAATPEVIPAAASAPARSKWLPDFGSETQIIHTKPVTAAAFMPEVTFMGAKTVLKTDAALTKTPAPVKAPAAETVAAAPVATETSNVVETPKTVETAKLETTPAETAAVETAIVETAIAEEPAIDAKPAVRAVRPRNDPLAPIMSLSEAERIALFT